MRGRRSPGRWIRPALHVLVSGEFLLALRWLRVAEGAETPRAVNDAAAVTAALLFACAVLGGGRSWRGVPLGRFFGTTAVAWTLLHLALTVFLQRYYPFPGWYRENPVAMTAAVAALAAFAVLVVRSFRAPPTAPGRSGRIRILAPAAYALALAHILLVSGTEWIRWFLVDPTSWPPPALGAFSILLVAVLLRSRALGRVLGTEPPDRVGGET